MSAIPMHELGLGDWSLRPGDWLPKTEATGAYSARGAGMSNQARLVADVKEALANPLEEGRVIREHGDEAIRLLALYKRRYPGQPAKTYQEYQARIEQAKQRRQQLRARRQRMRTDPNYRQQVREQIQARRTQTPEEQFRARTAATNTYIARQQRMGVPFPTIMRQVQAARAGSPMPTASTIAALYDQSSLVRAAQGMNGLGSNGQSWLSTWFGTESSGAEGAKGSGFQRARRMNVDIQKALEDRVRGEDWSENFARARYGHDADRILRLRRSRGMPRNADAAQRVAQAKARALAAQQRAAAARRRAQSLAKARASASWFGPMTESGGAESAQGATFQRSLRASRTGSWHEFARRSEEIARADFRQRTGVTPARTYVPREGAATTVPRPYLPTPSPAATRVPTQGRPVTGPVVLSMQPATFFTTGQ